jgi:hypothetical protein
MFVTALTRTFNWIICRNIEIQRIILFPSNILKLSSSMLLVLPSGLFLSGITRYRLRSSFMCHFVNRHSNPSPQLVYSAHPTCSRCSHFALSLSERKSCFSVGEGEGDIGMYVSRNVVLPHNHYCSGNATVRSLYC